MSSPAASTRVLIADVRDATLSLDEVIDAVRTPSSGGLVAFIGLVRDHDHGHDVVGLDYSAHPLATERLRSVCEAVAAAHPETRLAAVHRVGDLVVGDLAVVVAASAPHRSEAFEAARELIDTLKREVPIWKHQNFVGGGEEWVGIA
ncbi:MAG: molybdenum cofactor biosynthesis protein MoaE [Nostocoides sp.]